ncbi:MAG: hypothetical protein RIR73_1672 [Chloroflexota bacterium]|jgi:predicted nucleotidyltransferase component of viral defense system
MKREVGNIPASILARLRNKADEGGWSFNEILQYYGMERFLYRLSQTPHINDLILKGGLMFYGLGIPLRRTTRDIDFLGTSENTQSYIHLVFLDALSIQIPSDGIAFDVNTLRLSQTQVEANQGGIRASFLGHLGSTRIPVQVDIGFMDELSSEPLMLEYPVILPGMEKPNIKGYPPESIISEKFYAMLRFADANSRWKDYYDIYLLATTFEFDSKSLAAALRSTFENRPLKPTDQIPHGLRDEFANSNQQKWEIFLSKLKLQNEPIQDLGLAVKQIWRFLEYPLNELRTGQEEQKQWSFKNGWQKK